MFDLVVRIRLEPSVVRTYWSTERAWPGDTIAICVETKNVPDGTEVGIAIHCADLEDGPVLATAEGMVTNNRCVIQHKVDWDDDAMAEAFAAGASECLFNFAANLEPYELTGVSPAMYVPFEPME